MKDFKKQVAQDETFQEAIGYGGKGKMDAEKIIEAVCETAGGKRDLKMRKTLAGKIGVLKNDPKEKQLIRNMNALKNIHM